MSISLELQLASACSENRHLPPEVLERIFSHCDPSTLAVVARTSFASLELSSRYLYSDIVLDDWERLLDLLGVPYAPKKRWWSRRTGGSTTSRFTRFFRRRKVVAPARPSRIEPYASLSLIHSITFHIKSNVVQLDCHNRIAIGPLPVNVLAITFPAQVHEQPELTPLLALFDPKYILIIGCDDSAGETSTLSTTTHRDTVWHSQPAWNLYWSQLRTLVLQKYFWECLPIIQDAVTGLAGEVGLSPLVVVLDSTSIPRYRSEEIVEDIFDLSDELTTFELDVQIRLWVVSESVRDAVEQTLQARTTHPHDQTIRIAVLPVRVAALFDQAESGLRKGLDWAALEEM